MRRVDFDREYSDGGRTAAAVIVALALLAVGLPTRSNAGGLSLLGFGGSTAGVAYAGAAAGVDDATTLFYNPAGLSKLKRTQFALSGDVIYFTAGPFQDTGSFDALGAPMTGGDGGDPKGGFVPSFALALVDDSSAVRLGFAVNAPFGQLTEYKESWVGRYFATKSELKTVKLNVSASVRLNDWASVGGGFNALRARFSLANAIDFGSLCLGVAGPLCPTLGLRPQQSDGYGKISVSGWGYGYNLGFIFEPADRTSIGIAYQSRVTVDVDGSAKFDVPGAAQILTQGSGLFRDTSAEANVTFPDSVVVGLRHELSTDWTVLAGLTWTNWSLLDELAVSFGNPAQPSATLPADWQDAVYVSAGVVYRSTERLSLRAGIGYDQSPIPDSTRSPRLPGSDAVTLTAGAGFKLNDSVSLDLAIQYAIYDEARISLEEPGAGSLNGSFENNLLVSSLQLSMRF